MLKRKLSHPYTGSYRLTIPLMYIEMLGLKPGDEIHMEVIDEKIILTPVTSTILQDHDVTRAEATTLRGGYV